MKTTIEIPDALAAQAKDLAHTQGATLRELVVAGLRHEVERRQRITRVDFHLPTTPGEGMVVDVAPEHAIERSYDLPR